MIDYDCLTRAIDHLLDPSNPRNLLQSKSQEQLLWLLAQFISFRDGRNAASPDAKYVIILSKLISLLADAINDRVESPQYSKATSPPIEPLPDFVRREIATLVSQDNVKGLLTNLGVGMTASDGNSRSSENASALASYALTLLRVFPRRGDEIRMWLYQGSTAGRDHHDRTRLPAIKYLYQAASATQVFRDIIRDPLAVINLLKHDYPPRTSSYTESREQQWRIILLFLELYSFPLKIMDDEEFLSGSVEVDIHDSFTRQSALSLLQIEALTSFLKNLAFSMYWNMSEIMGGEDPEPNVSLAAYFGRDTSGTRTRDQVSKKRSQTALAGVSGLTIEYVKRMVTGVLRMLYERE